MRHKLLVLFFGLLVPVIGLQARRAAAHRAHSRAGAHHRVIRRVPAYRHHIVRPVHHWYGGQRPWGGYRSYPFFFTGGLYFDLVQSHRWDTIERRLNARIQELEDELEMVRNRQERTKLKQELEQSQRHLTFAQQEMSAAREK